MPPNDNTQNAPGAAHHSGDMSPQERERVAREEAAKQLEQELGGAAAGNSVGSNTIGAVAPDLIDDVESQLKKAVHDHTSNGRPTQPPPEKDGGPSGAHRQTSPPASGQFRRTARQAAHQFTVLTESPEERRAFNDLVARLRAATAPDAPRARPGKASAAKAAPSTPAMPPVPPEPPAPPRAEPAQTSPQQKTRPSSIAPEGLGGGANKRAPAAPVAPSPKVSPAQKLAPKARRADVTAQTNVRRDAGPPEEAKPPAKEEGPGLERLRTFKSDVARALKEGKQSMTKMVAAEQDRRARRAADVPRAARGAPQWRRFVVLGAAVLLLGGAAGGAYWWFFVRDTAPQENPSGVVEPPQLIRTNGSQEFETETVSQQSILLSLNAAKERVNLSLGNVENLYLTRPAAGGRALLTAGEFFETIGAGASPVLRRSLADTFVLGIHVFNGNQPFLLFQVNSYQRAFSEMLAWEERMNGDLAPLFGSELDRFVTPPGSNAPIEERAFEDLVLRNHDVRALHDNEGEIALLYTFPNNNFLIITTNEHTLTEVLTRMRSARIISDVD